MPKSRVDPRGSASESTLATIGTPERKKRPAPDKENRPSGSGFAKSLNARRFPARIVDFKRDKSDVLSKVVAIENDPNRFARVALLRYADGEERYILCPVGLRVGRTVMSGPKADIAVGNALPLKKIPAGTVVHNIELRPGKGAQMLRSPGAKAQLVSKEGGLALLRLPSSETRQVAVECMATVGELSRADRKNFWLGKVEAGTPNRSTRRRSSKEHSVPVHFAQVYPRAVEVIGDADKAARWLARPIPALNYETPISLLRDESGRDAVLDVLGRLEHGVF